MAESTKVFTAQGATVTTVSAGTAPRPRPRTRERRKRLPHIISGSEPKTHVGTDATAGAPDEGTTGFRGRSDADADRLLDASSTKEATPTGHRVVTTSAGFDASAAAPEEPGRQPWIEAFPEGETTWDAGEPTAGEKWVAQLWLHHAPYTPNVPEGSCQAGSAHVYV